jgi:hypothetical protein
MCGSRTGYCAYEQGWRESAGQLRVRQGQWRELLVQATAHGLGPSCDATVNLKAWPPKLHLAFVAVGNPTNGANGAAPDGEHDCTISRFGPLWSGSIPFERLDRRGLEINSSTLLGGHGR